MEHALALARKGVGLASPNPTVGCILVNNGEIVGEGFHQYDEKDHAEIVAIQLAGEKTRGATLYVTLEPCNHTGRTGPCTEAIIAAGIKRVVAAMEDPNPQTSGRGFEKLRAAGIEVESGLLEDQARRLNEGFACWICTKKPFVTLKSALTLDGQLALPGKNKKFFTKRGLHERQSWITSEESRAEVHRMRHTVDALLTGIGTVRIDDPLLTDRSGLPRRRRLLRVILDARLSIDHDAQIVKSTEHDVLIFTNAPASTRRSPALLRAGVEIAYIRCVTGRLDLDDVMTELGRRNILSVLIEAGPTLNGAAFSAGVVHKVALFYAPKIAGDNRVPMAIAPKLAGPAELENVRVRQFGPDIAIEGYLQNVYRNH